MPRAEVQAALAAALPYLVRDEVRKVRHNTVGASAGRGKYNWDAPPVTEHSPARVQRLRSAGRKGFDAAQARRDREAELLKTPVALGKGRWKALGDCTPADLRELAAQSRARADENVARADGYERLAREMEQRGVETVSGYDVAAIRDAFSNAA
jgi:hypothetical protein